MQSERKAGTGVALVAALVVLAMQASATVPPACRTGVVEGEVRAGEGFSRPLGNGLLLLLQPIHSGWIVRVLPANTPMARVGNPGFHDYAELATPPYNSISPLSISTDFALRSQDAVGWNPRRFRFASSSAAYGRLLGAYERLMAAAPGAGTAQASALAAEVASASDGLLTILDAQLAPGTADQGSMAAAVSANFPNTAHTLVQASDGRSSPLGSIASLRFRVELELPPGFRQAPSLKILPHLCGSR